MAIIDFFAKIVFALELAFFLFGIITLILPDFFKFTRALKSLGVFFVSFMVILLVFTASLNYTYDLQLPAGLFGEYNSLNYKGANSLNENILLELPKNNPAIINLVLDKKPQEAKLTFEDIPKDAKISINSDLSILKETILLKDNSSYSFNGQGSINLKELGILEDYKVSKVSFNLETTQTTQVKNRVGEYSAPGEYNINLEKGASINEASLYVKTSQVQNPSLTGNVILTGKAVDELTCNSCSDCNNQITSAQAGSIVKLSQDLLISSPSCLVINRSNIVFDCQNNKISFTTPNQYGAEAVKIYGGNVKINNCNIENFYTAVRIESKVSVDPVEINDLKVVRSSETVYIISPSNIIINRLDTSKAKEMQTHIKRFFSFGTGKLIIKDSKIYSSSSCILADRKSLSTGLNIETINNYFECSSPIGFYYSSDPSSNFGNLYINDKPISCENENLMGGECFSGNFYNLTQGTSNCIDSDNNGLCDQQILLWEESGTRILDRYPIALPSSSAQVPINNSIPLVEPVINCSDGLKNGNETDIDCGGNCQSCIIGKSCLKNSDCSTNLCQSGLCNQTIVIPQNLSNLTIQNSTEKILNIALNNKFIYSTNETKEANLNINSELISKQTECNNGLDCNIKLSIFGKGLSFLSNLKFSYSILTYSNIKMNNYLLTQGLNQIETEDKILTFTSEPSTNLKISNLTIEYIKKIETNDLSDQINAICQSYPCNLPIKIVSESGGNVSVGLKLS